MGGIFEVITAKFPSKKFGGATFYFDGEGKHIKLIEYMGRYVYAAKVADKDAYVFRTELGDDICLETKFNPKRTWVIPDILKLDDVTLYKQHEINNEFSELLYENIFEIISYTIIDDPLFKKCNFSRSLIKVIAKNSEGKCYAVPYLLGDDVHGGDEYPEGNIKGEAYKFIPLGTLRNKTIFVDI